MLFRFWQLSKQCFTILTVDKALTGFSCSLLATFLSDRTGPCQLLLKGGKFAVTQINCVFPPFSTFTNNKNIHAKAGVDLFCQNIRNF